MKIPNTYNKGYYFCNKCGKIFEEADNVLFVEDDTPRGFCSESCIESFFRPMVRLYEKIEEELRAKHELQGESSLKYLEYPSYLEKMLKEPEEVWVIENDLKEKYYSLISTFKTKDGKEFYFISLCLFYQGRPSFLFLVTVTESDKFVSEFRIGKQVNDLKTVLPKNKESKDAELVSVLERKKSFLLAELLKLRDNDDIAIFEFSEFESYINPTIEGPDEVYSFRDETGDKIHTYIKSFQNDQGTFYYFVLCLKVGKKEGKGLAPIISFPSRNGEIYKKFSQGNLVSGNLKN